MTRRGKQNGGDEDVYLMEKVVDYKKVNGVEWFLIKWEGFPSSENTWEPAKNILRPTAEILAQMEEFRSTERSKGCAPPPSKKRRTSAAVVRKGSVVAAEPRVEVMNMFSRNEPIPASSLESSQWGDLAQNTAYVRVRIKITTSSAEEEEAAASAPSVVIKELSVPEAADLYPKELLRWFLARVDYHKSRTYLTSTAATEKENIRPQS